ncbi:MAG TPA: hypothetical protein VG816_12400 [Solirubrobacterales bacterium]|nr:hypothetical protein [Solirubrobacterales bacterium]
MNAVEKGRATHGTFGLIEGCLGLAISVLGVWLCGLFALAPSAAVAAPTVFHVAPSGSGGECTVSEPCNIVDALTKLAKAGDTVQVAGNQGTYGLPNSPTLANIEVGQEVTLEGEPGQPMPVLYTEVSPIGVELQFGAKTIDFAVHDEKANATAIFGHGNNTLERVLATSNNGAGCAAPFESTVLDSACSGSVGIFDDIGGGPASTNLRNDTFYGTGEGGLIAATSGTYLVEAVNTIFLSPGPDIRAANLASATVEVALTHSSYFNPTEENGATITPGGGTEGNLETAPLLADPAAGDFHELAGSPTIDAALSSPADGALDLDGNVRSQPSSISCAGPGPSLPDIGAYELVPPAPSCPVSTRATAIANPTPAPAPPGRAGVKILALRKHGSAVTFRFAGTGEASGFQCRLDRHKWSRCRSPKRYSHLEPGKHRLAVRAIGPSGATLAAALVRHFVIAA